MERSSDIPTAFDPRAEEARGSSSRETARPSSASGRRRKQGLDVVANAYPFAAIVGQDEVKTALMIAAVDPSVGGVLVFGDRGTGKSTAVRGLADLLPERRVIAGCPYACEPDSAAAASCPHCSVVDAAKRPLKSRIPVVDLPLGATEDRLVGALDLESALTRGEKRFEPGLLAKANGGFLYVDEINLLEDHLVDLLLDVAASGVNVVEREGLSIRHPARFVLVGSGNPEEGELRPQLLDRFGFCVDVSTPREIKDRVEIIRRRDAYERDRDGFAATWAKDTAKLRRRIETARARLGGTDVPDAVLEAAARLCVALGTDGLRGELVLMRAARACAALEGSAIVSVDHLRKVAPGVLRHRLRRNPLDDTGSAVRIERAVAETLP
jgi:magnesium chelatase subunit I